jgi:hypothetical protein
LDEPWLVLSLEKAALRAGHQEWPLAPEVARAVLHYLRNDFIRSVIERDTLEMILRRSLTGIGCPAIARHFELASSSPSITATGTTPNFPGSSAGSTNLKNVALVPSTHDSLACRTTSSPSSNT